MLGLIPSHGTKCAYPVYLFELRCPLCESLGNPAVEVCTFLGIRAILDIGDLEFPILFSKCEDGQRIVADLIAVDSVTRG
jgi:hypothetical protein